MEFPRLDGVHYIIEIALLQVQTALDAGHYDEAATLAHWARDGCIYVAANKHSKATALLCHGIALKNDKGRVMIWDAYLQLINCRHPAALYNAGVAALMLNRRGGALYWLKRSLVGYAEQGNRKAYREVLRLREEVTNSIIDGVPIVYIEQDQMTT